MTGGAGFIGSHLVERLALEGAHVFVFDKAVKPGAYFESRGLVKKAKLYHKDFNDFKTVKKILAECRPEIIFHIGAQAIVPEALANPYEAFLTNVLGTVNILEAARQAKFVRGVVVASSDKAYGKDCVNAREEQKVFGDHPYDASKASADIIARTYFKTYGLPVAVSRFGNVYGGGDVHFSRIVPGALQAIISGRTLEIRSNGQFRRDYVYVKDVVDGYLKLAGNIDKIKGEAFNFSSGQNFSVLELVEKIGEVIGKKCDYKILNDQQNEIPEQSLNFEKAQKVLGWKSKYPFEQGIKETYEWYKTRKDL